MNSRNHQSSLREGQPFASLPPFPECPDGATGTAPPDPTRAVVRPKHRALDTAHPRGVWSLGGLVGSPGKFASLLLDRFP